MQALRRFNFSLKGNRGPRNHDFWTKNLIYKLNERINWYSSISSGICILKHCKTANESNCEEKGQRLGTC